MKLSAFILIGISTITFNTNVSAQQETFDIKVSGAMSNVMRHGQLQGTIKLDTISNTQGLYAIGPKALLKGEILVIDGRSFVSTVDADGSIKMEETYQVEAPFLVYTNNTQWKKVAIPDSVQSMQALEFYIDAISKDSKRPFVFKLEGTFEEVQFHVQNLPDGTIVRSPKDAHQNQGKYVSKATKGTIIGFFSTEHQSVFTHHDAYTHLHYIDDEFSEMGHVDGLTIGDTAGITLYLPID